MIIPEKGSFVKHGGQVQTRQPPVSEMGASGVPRFVKELKTGYNTPHEYSAHEE